MQGQDVMGHRQLMPSCPVAVYLLLSLPFPVPGDILTWLFLSLWAGVGQLASLSVQDRT